MKKAKAETQTNLKYNKSMPQNEEEEDLDFASLLEQYCDIPKSDLVIEPKQHKKQTVICDINLEYGMPTVDQALIQMKYELANARRNHYCVARLIHGYGSTGKGGAIRRAVRKVLVNAIPGEEFDIFHEETRRLLNRYPRLKTFPDLGNYNQGVTFVVLR